jgi:hypothetical protein
LAAAAPFFFLQTLLGLSVRSFPRKELCFSHPVLPDFLSLVAIPAIPMGDACVDAVLARGDGKIEVAVSRKPDDLEVTVTQ